MSHGHQGHCVHSVQQEIMLVVPVRRRLTNNMTRKYKSILFIFKSIYKDNVQFLYFIVERIKLKKLLLFPLNPPCRVLSIISEFGVLNEGL